MSGNANALIVVNINTLIISSLYIFIRGPQDFGPALPKKKGSALLWRELPVTISCQSADWRPPLPVLFFASFGGLA
jgi:hypothetical protein